MQAHSMVDSAKEIIPVNLEDEMRRSYLDYAMSVIVGRALPDVRDGLKPVHRRVLFAMNELGAHSNKPYFKSARIVGDVIGKYHPHGDQSVYDTLVRMAQPFSLRYMLVDGQGNFGSVDGDSAAAMRYTEARMARLTHELMADIDKETVDFQPNYDEKELEPSVMPTRFPNLLVNGSAGIAVGMATNIPPHNLGEVVDAALALLDDPAVSDEALLDIVPGAAAQALARMGKADPAPFMSAEAARLVTPGDLDRDLETLADADWIVEAIVEEPRAKRALYERLEAVRRPGSVVSSNTSTIPLAYLLKGLPASFAADFLITHFFNPPRYMRLLELVAGPATRPEAVETVRSFADRRLGKGVVLAKDTPGFIANRVGDYGLGLAIMAMFATFGTVTFAGVAQAPADAFQAQALAGQAALHVQHQAALQVVQALHQLAAVRGQQFGGGRGRRRAHVGDEVGDGYIGLMAHGADDGRDTGGHGAGHDFLVEAPEIFQRAAAAGEDQGVEALGVRQLQRTDDLPCGFAALHGGGDQRQLHLRCAAAEHRDDVADHCAGR